eukprot:TRINITY_DN7731_c0_g1_i1.p1 TRINITY_DN7731_c0_g1~~TRINITY_DN7731_c0_g1_i1.p1  ORF type:complete len:393 (+),score=117.71 TRINITY_DN7731_c0_g1_i1:34-1179(+)
MTDTEGAAVKSAEMENKEREVALKAPESMEKDDDAGRKKRMLNADAMPWFPKSQRKVKMIDADTMLSMCKNASGPPASIPADLLLEGPLTPEMVHSEPPSVCRTFAQGKCRKGDACQYVHSTSIETKQYIQLQREEEAILKALEVDRKARAHMSEAEVQSRTVHIIGFDSSTTEEMFLAKMSVHGAIRKFQLCGDVKQPTRYGFVEYISPEAAKKAILMDGKKLGIRRLRVSLAKEGIKGGLTIGEDQQVGILKCALRRRERNGLFKDPDYPKMCLPDCKLQPFIQRAKALALHNKYETVGNDSFNYANFCPMQNKEDGASPPDTPLHPLRLCTQESMAHMFQLALSYHPEAEECEPEDDSEDDLLEGSSKDDETECASSP